MIKNNSINSPDMDNVSKNENQVNPVKFSFYAPPVKNTVPCRVMNLLEVYQLIKSDHYQWQTESLRTITDPIVARNYKASHFSYCTFSGTFTKRKNEALIEHSGLITIDFDHVPDVVELKKALLADANLETELLFKSPSGDGLKLIISIDLEQGTHLEYFLSISNYIKTTYKLDIDPTGKEVSRACFLCFDDEVYINPKHIQ